MKTRKRKKNKKPKKKVDLRKKLTQEGVLMQPLDLRKIKKASKRTRPTL